MNQKTKIKIYESVLKKLAHYYSTSESSGVNELCKNVDRWVYSLTQEKSEENERLVDWTYRTLDNTPETDTLIRRRERKNPKSPRRISVF